MGVVGSSVAGIAQQNGICGVGDIHDGHCVFIESEANFLAHVFCIWAIVVHDLCIVGVAIFRKAANQAGRRGVGQVQDVQASAERVAAHSISPAALFIDGDVVGIAKPGIVAVLCEGDGRIGHIAQPGQIKDLQTVACGFRDDVCMVVVHLHIPPQRTAGVRGEQAHHDRGGGGCDIHKSSGSRHAHYGILAAIQWVGPSPQVFRISTAEIGRWHKAHQVDQVARVPSGKAVFTWGLRP